MEYTEHHFPPNLAAAHGVDIAIFLRNIYHWIQKNKANGKHFHDGRYWTYNSMAAYGEVFPYWTKRQIERIIARCKEAGLLVTDTYNEDPRDRTQWYSLTEDALAFFCNDTKAWFCISPNGEMHDTKQGHSSHQTVTPLPDNKPDNDPPCSPPAGGKPARRRKQSNEPKEAPDWKPERFAAFWAAYPCGKSKQAAIKAWDALHASDELLDEMARGLQNALHSRQWREGIGIPYASTWINQRRWEDEERSVPSDEAQSWAADPEVI